MRLDELAGITPKQPSWLNTPPPVEKKVDKAKKNNANRMPEHPLMYDLENKSLVELANISMVLFAPGKKKQINRQLAESVVIEVTIDPDAIPGDRELRINTATGLTNPMIFQVGLLPEFLELEPNSGNIKAKIPKWLDLPENAEPLDLPVEINGQIFPGDMDRFKLLGKKGQKLVIETQARRLIPYLADAVPGWFQATIALYDSAGKEVAYADDYQFNPDPVLFYEIPEDGPYELEIRDAIYRGREDFVYRIAISEQPFMTHIFPLGGREGEKTVAAIDGWNLPETRLELNTQPGNDPIRKTAYYDGKTCSNSVTFAVDTLPECHEREGNNAIGQAQQVTLPIIINGRIDRNDDVDIFQIKGNAGEELVVEVMARQLNSPLDSLVRLTNNQGEVLAWNDDYVVKESHLHKDMMGLITHHADSYLKATLPKTGTYYVHLADAQNHGGKSHAYRLRISPPQPDFALRITPPSHTMRPGAITPIRVHALRKDGFTGEIQIMLKDPSGGFKLTGNVIPAGSDSVRMTLSAPPIKSKARTTTLQFAGTATINQKSVTRPAIPSEDLTQAFLYRHLVPSQEFMVSILKYKWPLPAIELMNNAPIQISAGGETIIKFKTRRNATALKQIQLELNNPPEGVSLGDVKVTPNGLACQVRIAKDIAQKQFAGNLILEAFTTYQPKPQNGKPQKKRRVSAGVLPAVPVRIVQ